MYHISPSFIKSIIYLTVKNCLLFCIAFEQSSAIIANVSNNPIANITSKGMSITD